MAHRLAVLPLMGLALTLAIPAAGRAQMMMSPEDSARHVLNRLAYGATPGEVQAVAREGVLRWIDRQLGFREVADPALTQLEATFDILQTRPAELEAMQQKQIQMVQRAQAQGGDSAAQRQLLAQMRASQQDGRKDLRTLLQELPALTLIRAVQSDRQLPEILTDFWTNHFNVYINKNQDRAYFPDYLEHTIRAHALGSFEDLLVATATSPAMLSYLDNVQSVVPGMDPRAAQLASRPRVAVRPGSRRFVPANPGANRGLDSAQMARIAANMPRGLNENYARELMELHTLGVDGGYTQDDVINVARILTGWSVDRQSGEYLFRAPAHDRGAKVALGTSFPAGHGEDEGRRLLKILAESPATMHHVSAQLCARFVADQPPDGCIDDAVRAWQQSHGEIRAVVRAIIMSPDFWAPTNVENKVKTPLEFVVSAVRAVNGIPDGSPRLAAQVAKLGEPLFQMQTPNGYGETQEDWVNSGALLARMNFAVALASGRMPGVVVDLDQLIPLTGDRAALVDAVNRTVLAGAMTAHTREVILKEIADLPDPRTARAMAVGMAIGGPEFQKQ